MSSTLAQSAEESLVPSLQRLVDVPPVMDGLMAAMKIPRVTKHRRGVKGTWYLHIGGERGPSTKTTDEGLAEAFRQMFIRQWVAERMGVVNRLRTPLAEVFAFNLTLKSVPPVASKRTGDNYRERRNEILRLLPYIEGLTIQDVTPEWGQKTEAALQVVDGYAYGTMRATLSAFQTMLSEYAAHCRIVLPPLFKLPPLPPKKERVATHEEFERIVGVGEGFVWDAANGCWAEEDVVDPATGQTFKRRLMHPPATRVRLAMGLRLAILAFFTGTRHTAVVDLRWLPNTRSGWIDLDAGIINRVGQERPSLNKGHDLYLFFDGLRSVLTPWFNADMDRRVDCVIHRTDAGHHGKPYANGAYGLWNDLMEAAGITDKLTPHVGKKTLASWLRILRVPRSSTASLLSTREETLGRHYEMVERLHEQVPAALAIDKLIREGFTVPFAATSAPNRYATAFIPYEVAALPQKTREALGVCADIRQRRPIYLPSTDIKAHFELRPPMWTTPKPADG